MIISFGKYQKKKKIKGEKKKSIFKNVEKRQCQNSEFFTCLAVVVPGQNSDTGEVLLKGLQVEYLGIFMIFINIKNHDICSWWRGKQEDEATYSISYNFVQQKVGQLTGMAENLGAKSWNETAS